MENFLLELLKIIEREKFDLNNNEIQWTDNTPHFVITTDIIIKAINNYLNK